MKVLLAAVNARFSHANLALRSLRAYAEDTSHDFIITEYTINTPLREILSDIYSRKPDVLALSIYIWNAVLAGKIVSEIKKILPNLIIITGGPEVSFSAQDWLIRHPAIDTIIIHAGEQAFRELAQNNFRSNERIMFRDNPSFDELPFPYTENELLELKEKLFYYESSRGCLFRCAYCLSSSYSQRIDYRSLEKVKTEIALIASHNIRTVKFVDRTFNADEQRAINIISFISSLKTTSVFHLELHPSLITDNIISVLSSAPDGRFQFECGFQSADADALMAINRTQNPVTAAANIARLAALKKFHVHADLIAGLPDETFESFARSFDMLYAASADHIQLGFLKLLPGTALKEKESTYNYQSMEDPPYEIISSNKMSFFDLTILHNIEELVESIHNSKLFPTTLSHLMSDASPFSFFRSLAEYASNISYDLQTRDRKKTSGLLKDFCESRGIDQLLVSDSLAWDAFTAKEPRGYTDLAGENYQAVREESLALLKACVKTGKEIPVSSKDYGKIIFFKPRSPFFSAPKYINGSIYCRYMDIFFTIG